MAGTQHQNGKGADPEHRIGRALADAMRKRVGKPTAEAALESLRVESRRANGATPVRERLVEA